MNMTLNQVSHIINELTSDDLSTKETIEVLYLKGFINSQQKYDLINLVTTS